MSKLKDNDLRSFDVPEAARHSSGYTSYKIILQVTPKDLSEDPYQLVYWKRYSEIRHLYSILDQYHHAILRPGDLPIFPDKSGYLERFQPGIIEQRRLATKDFLNFALKQIYLHTHAAYVAFFQNGEKVCLPAIATQPIQPDVVYASSLVSTSTIGSPVRCSFIDPKKEELLLRIDDEESLECATPGLRWIHDDLQDLQFVAEDEEKNGQNTVETDTSSDLISMS